MASYARGVPRSSTSNINERETLLPSNGAQVQNVKAARVYVFGDGNPVEDDEDDVVEYEMRSRHKAAFPSKVEESRPEFFEREVHEGETLQGIALKYACNVSDLKRLNNLIQDQEFFALKTVKVPITRFGVLSESGEVQQSRKITHSKASSTYLNGAAAMSDVEDDQRDLFYDSESQHDFSDPETQMKVLKTLSISENISAQGKEAKQFLRKMDKDLSKLKSPRAERESLTEVISFLTNKSIRPLDRTMNQSSINRYNGADCGITWWSLLLCILGMSILVPLLYLVYYYFLKS